MDSSTMSELTLVLQAVENREKTPSEDLLLLVYEALRRVVAARMVPHSGDRTLQPTTLVHVAASSVGSAIVVCRPRRRAMLNRRNNR
jgi:hypothetical protein